MAGAIAAAVAQARHRITRAFLEAGATAPERAMPYAPGRRRIEVRAFRRFLDFGAIREVEPGHYYLDELRMGEFQASIRKRVWIVAGLAAAMAGVAFAIGS